MNVASLSAILKSAFRFPVWNADADALIAPDGSEVALGGGSWDGVLAKGTITTDVKVTDLSVTWNNAGVTFTGLKLNVTDTASAGQVTTATIGSLLADFQVGGVSKVAINKSGTIVVKNATANESFAHICSSYLHTGISWRGSGYVLALLSAGVPVLITQAQQVILSDPRWLFGWSATGGSTTQDVVLARDAAGSLAQRNGTNAQTFNIYNTYTDASNYERGFMKWSSNVLEVGAEAAGTGTQRAIKLQMGSGGSAGISIFSATSLVATFNSDRFQMDNAAFFGYSDIRIYRAAANILNFGATSTSTGSALQMQEMTAPAAPSTNGVRIYAEDNGSGKTRLMALFATGAAQQLAIEP